MIRFVLLILVLSFVGCASATYEVTNVDGSVNKITYRVLGAREFTKVRIDPKTGMVEIGKSKGEAGVLGEALADSAKTALNLSKMAGGGM